MRSRALLSGLPERLDDDDDERPLPQLWRK
jgi:hypothetical protein